MTYTVLTMSILIYLGFIYCYKVTNHFESSFFISERTVIVQLGDHYNLCDPHSFFWITDVYQKYQLSNNYFI